LSQSRRGQGSAAGSSATAPQEIETSHEAT
jgi:hypothetical protein